jgi:hypothetical protein
MMKTVLSINSPFDSDLVKNFPFILNCVQIQLMQLRFDT